MGSPKAGSPRLSRFLPSSVRKRRPSFGSSKKSNNTGTASGGSSQRTPPSKTLTGNNNQDIRDSHLSPKSSTSSTNHLRNRHRSVPADVSPLRSPNTNQFGDDDVYKENASGTGSENAFAAPKFSERLGGFLPNTPNQGYQSLPQSTSLPDPSPKPRFAMSRVKSPRSNKSTASPSWKASESPSTRGSQPSTQNSLGLPNFDSRSNENHLDAAANVTLRTPKSEGNRSPFDNDGKKSAEKRDNRGRGKGHGKLDFLSFGKSRKSSSADGKAAPATYIAMTSRFGPPPLRPGSRAATGTPPSDDVTPAATAEAENVPPRRPTRLR